MEEKKICASIAETIKTYRKGEIAEPNADHVAKWASQFSKENCLEFLREFDHVIKKTFLSREAFTSFVRVISSEIICNSDEEILNFRKKVISSDNIQEYWRKVNVLDIQKNGESQKSIMSILDECLFSNFSFHLHDCGNADGEYIYIDDIIFSGSRVITDLKQWIDSKEIKNATVKIIAILSHALGEYYIKKSIRELFPKRNININICAFKCLENRLSCKDKSNVLWPTEIPSMKCLESYLADKNCANIKLRSTIQSIYKTAWPFSSEKGRQLLEREFLVAGAKIHSSGSVSKINRPLGHSNFDFGFGSLLVTYRNCPNNCPLAIWWGEEGRTGALNWYPLLPRKVYSYEAFPSSLVDFRIDAYL